MMSRMRRLFCSIAAIVFLAGCTPNPNAPQISASQNAEKTPQLSGDSLLASLMIDGGHDPRNELDSFVALARDTCRQLDAMDVPINAKMDAMIMRTVGSGRFGNKPSAEYFVQAAVLSYCPRHEGLFAD